MKSEFQDGGFRRHFPRGLVVVDSMPCPDGTSCFSSLQWEKVTDALAADYDFLAKVGVIDYSLLITYWEGFEDGLSEDAEAQSSHCFLAHGPPYDANGAPSRLCIRLGIIDFLQP